MCYRVYFHKGCQHDDETEYFYCNEACKASNGATNDADCPSYNIHLPFTCADCLNKVQLHLPEQLSDVANPDWKENPNPLPLLYERNPGEILAEDDKACSICSNFFSEVLTDDLEPMGTSEYPIRLCCPGKHIFGHRCIFKWFQTQRAAMPSCPLCRFSFSSEEFSSPDEINGYTSPRWIIETYDHWPNSRWVNWLIIRRI